MGLIPPTSNVTRELSRGKGFGEDPHPFDASLDPQPNPRDWSRGREVKVCSLTVVIDPMPVPPFLRLRRGPISGYLRWGLRGGGNPDDLRVVVVLAVVNRNLTSFGATVERISAGQGIDPAEGGREALDLRERGRSDLTIGPDRPNWEGRRLANGNRPNRVGAGRHVTGG